MKKIGKLSINVDKIIKNEELVNLRGGDYYYGCTPGSISGGYWQCCVDGESHTFYKNNANDANRVCESYYGEGKCNC